MELRSDPRVKEIFNSYPELARDRLNHLRDLILETASEIDGIGNLEETLKWGEPSYLTKHSSTIRIDWKEKSPGQYAVYFKCTSKLVPTFKIIYKETFEYEGNRSIVFSMDDKIPEKELKQCIRMALTYHKVKQLPLLGA
jgi:hypothetical protein